MRLLAHDAETLIRRPLNVHSSPVSYILISDLIAIDCHMASVVS